MFEQTKTITSIGSANVSITVVTKGVTEQYLWQLTSPNGTIVSGEEGSLSEAIEAVGEALYEGYDNAYDETLGLNDEEINAVFTEMN